MKLSMSLIARYLRKYEPECHILDDTVTIKGVRFFADQLPEYSLEYVYLGTSREYFQDPRYADALLLSSGQNQIICRGADYEELLNDVLSSFEYYNLLEQELLSAAAEHCPVSEIMRTLERVISDPVTVFDLDGELIASANESAIRDREFLDTIRNLNILGTNIIGRVFTDREGRISHDLTDQPQHLHTPGAKEMGAVAMYLSRQEERVGFLLMFPADEAEVMAGLCLMPVFAKAFVSASEFVSADSLLQGSRSVFLRLLQGEELSSDVMRSFENMLNPETGSVVAVFRTIAIRNYTFRSMLKRELEKLEGSGLLCICGEDLVMLSGEKEFAGIVPYLRSSICPRNIVIGVSMPIQKPEQIRIAHEQAVFAAGSSNTTGIIWCRELALPYLLRSLNGIEMAGKLLHPAIPQLEEYDEQNGTDFLQTLRIFIRLRCSQRETAETLHIHLNTLKYRLHRIGEVCRIDYKDPQELFYLELSFSMLQSF